MRYDITLERIDLAPSTQYETQQQPASKTLL